MKTTKQQLMDTLIQVCKLENKPIVYIPSWELAMFVDEFTTPSDSGVNPQPNYQFEGYTYPDLNVDRLFTSGEAVRRLPEQARELAIEIPPHMDFLLIKTK